MSRTLLRIIVIVLGLAGAVDGALAATGSLHGSRVMQFGAARPEYSYAR